MKSPNWNPDIDDENEIYFASMHGVFYGRRDAERPLVTIAYAWLLGVHAHGSVRQNSEHFPKKIDGNFQQIVLAMRDTTALIKNCAAYRTLVVSSGRT
jgi:hypothetical protein